MHLGIVEPKNTVIEMNETSIGDLNRVWEVGAARTKKGSGPKAAQGDGTSARRHAGPSPGEA